jgi:UDP-N-acetylmuramoyl-tripeptide--D-alanyl-D-alanine ligase
MAARTRADVLTFGRAGDVRFEAVRLDEFGRPSFRLGHRGRWCEVNLRDAGRHQVDNATAAAAMALAVGVPLDRIAVSLSAAANASPMRMETHRRADGLLVINDAYNANPDSMLAALAALREIGAGGTGAGAAGRRTVAVLGEMRELGPETGPGHRRVGRAAAELGIDVVVVVGRRAAGIADGVRSVPGWAGQLVNAPGRDEALAWVRENIAGAGVVLVKASRGAALETIADGLLEGDGPTT